MKGYVQRGDAELPALGLGQTYCEAGDGRGVPEGV